MHAIEMVKRDATVSLSDDDVLSAWGLIRISRASEMERALTLIAEMDGYVPARSDWDMVSIARAALGDAT